MIVINGWLKEPEAYDASFWEYNEYNINQLAIHTHDGTLGDKLPPTSLLQDNTQTVQPNVSQALGLYYADVTMPTDYDFDDTSISFFDGSDRVYLDYTRLTDESFRVFSAFNDVTYGVRYA